MLEFGPNGHIKSRVEAKSGDYADGIWTFKNGSRHFFDENDEEQGAQDFDKLSLSLKEKPSDFLKEQREPQQMSFNDLLVYIDDLRNNGSDVHKEEVYLFYKFASPFGCVILALLGVPWGWSMRKYSGRVIAFAICILVGFIYYGGMAIGQDLGNSGIVSPFLSAWFINFVFLLLTLWMLAWKNR